MGKGKKVRESDKPPWRKTGKSNVMKQIKQVLLLGGEKIAF